MSLPFNGRRPYTVTPPTPFRIALRILAGLWFLWLPCVVVGAWGITLTQNTERAVTVTGPARVSPFECR